MVEPLVLGALAVVALLVLAFVWKMVKLGLKIAVIGGILLLAFWALRAAGVIPGGG